ncbi:iron transporter [Jeotgalicoccus coquinae]|uniref:Manganese transport protein MntH n=1 Tax=Jeotgalicoccus coquinae TaxID=709509 RepID=A0A6V7RSB4_9STAP|nr:NRAMP family divalent metal transporter [Jeotgalicoccus coquinae]MBB6424198.1 Mn2+/Fe2+ NRAMP family transporter [Jeotgalicoccus coquinae]GGE25695.1 iron transporter [Jeotgalicoccus coquinae]CAD2081513.1 manganese transport protein MntH [Jeotgalicoccus coquinae]
MENKPKITAAQRRLLFGAVFLMATSSIGPAFLTQTTVFTQQFMASFAFAIVASIVIDIGAQLNIWRVLSVSGKRGQDVANEVFPGLGSFVAVLIIIGGFAFNIGNVAGAGLGFNAIFGWDVRVGAAITGIFAIIIFLIKNGRAVMDIVTQVLGVLMIGIVAYVMIISEPPVAEAAKRAVLPEEPLTMLLPIITLVGGTVGGYITFAGAHRLIEAGMTGEKNLRFVSHAANWGILTTGIMRVLLFLAVLGVLSQGAVLSEENPPASVFEFALGDIGMKIFGVVLLAAALSSVIGAAYTSASFMRSFNKVFDRYNNIVIVVFIATSTLIFLFVGRPVTLLILAGSFNGLILPITLGAILLASRKKSIVGNYHHPTWMIVFGIVAVIVTLIAGVLSLQGLADLWNG